MEKELKEYYQSTGRRMPNVVVEDIEKLTQLEWLQTRQKGIGGSDSGPVFYGVGTYKTAFDIAVSKMETINSVPENSAEKQYMFDYGHAIELCLGNYYKNTKNAHVFYDRGMYYHPDYPFMLCDCDGFAVTANGETIGLEFKSANPFTKDEWHEGIYGEDGVVHVPDYVCQVQHYMAVMDLDRYDIVVDFKSGNPKDIKIISVYRDDDFIANLIAKEKEFWENRENIPLPEVIKYSDEVERTARKLVELGAIIEGDTLNSVVQEYIELKERKSYYEREARSVGTQLDARKASMLAAFEENKNDTIIFGENVLEKVTKTTSRYDTDILKKMPELEKYKKETITVSFKLNKKKI